MPIFGPFTIFSSSLVCIPPVPCDKATLTVILASVVCESQLVSEVEALMTNELGGRRRAGLPGCNFQFSVTLVTFLVTAHTPTKRSVY